MATPRRRGRSACSACALRDRLIAAPVARFHVGATPASPFFIPGAKGDAGVAPTGGARHRDGRMPSTLRVDRDAGVAPTRNARDVARQSDAVSQKTNTGRRVVGTGPCRGWIRPPL